MLEQVNRSCSSVSGCSVVVPRLLFHCKVRRATKSPFASREWLGLNEAAHSDDGNSCSAVRRSLPTDDLSPRRRPRILGTKQATPR
ncbi:hypothetical protein LSAT2_027040 [Lamellibrachia satsuma]|nr:hypothetical protein LSAT2_027040 [Lamellibrachia satsuma]